MNQSPKRFRIVKTTKKTNIGDEPAGIPVAVTPTGTFTAEFAQSSDLSGSMVEGTEAPLYRALLRGLYDAILIVDPGGKVVDCNRRARSFFQYAFDDFMGMTLGKVVSGMSADIFKRVQDNLAGGRFTVLDAFCIRRDATRFPAEITISRLTTDARDDLVFSIKNITRRRAMEDRLRTEHNALQNSASGIVITDRDAAITYANTAFLTMIGDTEENILGKNMRSFWKDEEQTRALVDLPSAGREWAGELSGRHRSGKEIRVQATASANRDAKEAQVGMVFSFVDITEKHKAQEAIRREADAQIQSARNQDAFSGRLNIISLTDVMQLINTAGKTGTLTVVGEGGTELGKASFSDGELIVAECGGITGEKAVIRLLGTPEGLAFQFTPGSIPKQDGSIQKSLMSLLMESAQAIDEEGEA